VLDAVVTAGGRLSDADAATYGTDVKALVRVGARTLLRSVIDALRGVAFVRSIVVVGPASARVEAAGVDEWIDEFPTGEENLFAAIGAARTERIIMSASDLPFVTTNSFEDLIARAADADAGYPIFRKDEFLRAFPSGRASFARLANGEWTGGSAFVLNRALVQEHAPLIRRGFGARKNPALLAWLLGPVLSLKFAFGVARIEEAEAVASSRLGGRVRAIVGADPALAMDCDHCEDIEYAREHAAS